MSEQEMLNKIKELEEKNSQLTEERNELKKLMTKRITAGTLTPYQIITSTISDKVEIWQQGQLMKRKVVLLLIKQVI